MFDSSVILLNTICYNDVVWYECDVVWYECDANVFSKFLCLRLVTLILTKFCPNCMSPHTWASFIFLTRVESYSARGCVAFTASILCPFYGFMYFSNCRQFSGFGVTFRYDLCTG